MGRAQGLPEGLGSLNKGRNPKKYRISSIPKLGCRPEAVLGGRHDRGGKPPSWALGGAKTLASGWDGKGAGSKQRGGVAHLHIEFSQLSLKHLWVGREGHWANICGKRERGPGWLVFPDTLPPWDGEAVTRWKRT